MKVRAGRRGRFAAGVIAGTAMAAVFGLSGLGSAVAAAWACPSTATVTSLGRHTQVADFGQV